MNVEINNQNTLIPVISYATEAGGSSPLHNSDFPEQIGEIAVTPEPTGEPINITSISTEAYNISEKAVMVGELTLQEFQVNVQIPNLIAEAEAAGISKDVIEHEVKTIPDSDNKASWQFVMLRAARDFERTTSDGSREKVEKGSILMPYIVQTSNGPEARVAVLHDFDGDGDRFKAEMIVIPVDSETGRALPVLKEKQNDGSYLPIAILEFSSTPEGLRAGASPVEQVRVQAEGANLRATETPNNTLVTATKGQDVLVFGYERTYLQGKNAWFANVQARIGNKEYTGIMSDSLVKFPERSRLSEVLEELKAAEEAKALENITLPESPEDIFARIDVPADEQEAFLNAYYMLSTDQQKMVFVTSAELRLTFDAALDGFTNKDGEVLRPQVGFVIQEFAEVLPNGTKVTLEAPRGYFDRRKLPTYNGLTPDILNKLPGWERTYLQGLQNQEKQTQRIIFVENVSSDGDIIPYEDLGLHPIDFHGKISGMAIGVAQSIGENDTVFYVAVYPIEYAGLNLDQANYQKLYATLLSRATASALVAEYYQYAQGQTPTDPWMEFQRTNGGHPAVQALVSWPDKFSNYLKHTSIFTP